MNGLIPRNIEKIPLITFPSFLSEFEDLFPTTNLLNGLSISDDEKNVYVETAVPGVDSKDIDVTYSKGILTIKAKRKEEEKGKTYQRRATESFLYRVSPDGVDAKLEPTAELKNGVMKVTFAKTPEEKAKKIAVKSA